MLTGSGGRWRPSSQCPCTYDFDIAAAKYLHGLRDGNIPLSFLFSGTVISRGATGYAVTQIPWHKECTFPLPVATWRRTVDLYWPGGGWMRVRTDTLDALQAYKVEHGFTDWDAVLGSLSSGPSSDVRRRRRSKPCSTAPRPIADAVLWEGYVLYPYRRSAAKNRIRFQWGVVGPAEEPTMTPHRARRAGDRQVHVRVRFLHLHRREDGWDEAVDVERDACVALAVGTGAAGRPARLSTAATAPRRWPARCS